MALAPTLERITPRRLALSAWRRLARPMLVSLAGVIPRTFITTENIDWDHQLPPGSDEIVLVTIAFNNTSLLPVQHALLKRYVPSINHLVADNSSAPSARKFFREFCRKNGIRYISLPPFPPLDPSSSHGVAVNWVVKRYIQHRRPSAFGLLDHDIFPVGRFEVKDYLKSNTCAFGHIIQRGDRHWYLWPGLSFFSTSFLELGPWDFRPANHDGVVLDTGGGNWPRYNEMSRDTLPHLEYRLVKLRDENDPAEDWVTKVRGSVEHIGPWVHMINGSYWLGSAPKEQLTWRYLQQLVDIELPLA